MGFTHLHLHTDYSILDGMGKVNEYVKRAKKLGMTAIAITDHGTMGGCINFYNACEKEGIKPIIGSEFYEAPYSRFDKSETKKSLKASGEDGKDYYHLILLAKNQKGYENLCTLTTRANVEGFYRKPRIDKELLKEFSEGIVCLSGCVAGRVAQDVLRGELAAAESHLLEYKEIFGEDFYVEIQNHGLEDEKKAFSVIQELAKKHNIKCVATNDCHYVESEDKEAHEWLIAMQTGKTIYDTDRMIYEGDYSLKSEEEMTKLFPENPAAIINTMEIADKCHVEFKKELEISDYRMPNVTIPAEYGTDYFRYLSDLAFQGWDKKYPVGHTLRDKAKEQLIFELGIIKQMNFAEYFLDTRETIVWSLENGIYVGSGRGSGVGSVMNYCLDITSVEPLRHSLLFERFLNPERISMPDIDVDYEKRHKDRVVKHEADKNGHDKFARIGTYGTMKAKGVLKDVVRTAGLPVDVGNKFSKFIPSDPKATLKDSYDNNIDLQNFIASNKDYQKVWEIALKLEGTKKSEGMHACGAIPTPIKCEKLFPCRVDSKTGYLVCQYDMTEAEHLGNLKKDLLMLNNLTIISTAHELIEKRYGFKLGCWTDEIIDDKATLKLIAEGRTDGVFQLESDGMKGFMRDLKPSCFEDIVAGVALYRPGPMDSIPRYTDNKRHPEKVEYAVPELKPILENTYGIIVYQEQVMQIVQALAGFSKGEADVVRKAMGKKKQELIEKEGEIFLHGNDKYDGCLKRGVPEEVANDLWEKMAKFGAYAFNKSHAVGYACIAMQTAYLKCHYPLEFYAGLLTSVMDAVPKVAKYISDAKKEQIEILPPDINSSYQFFTPSKDDKLIYGIESIKGVGTSVAAAIIEEREKNGKYKSLYDFMERTNAKKSVCASLINAGAFDFTGVNRPSLLESIEVFKKELKKNEKDDKAQLSLMDFLEELQPTSEPEYAKKDDYDSVTKALMEREVTGLFVKTNPLAESKLDVNYTPIVELRELWKSDEQLISEAFGDDAENDVEIDNDAVSELLFKKEMERKEAFAKKHKLHGIITELEPKITKSGDRMCIMTLVDDLSEIKVLVFPKVYAKLEKMGKEYKVNDVVTLEGRPSDSQSTPQLNLDNLWLDSELERIQEEREKDKVEKEENDKMMKFKFNLRF